MEFFRPVDPYSQHITLPFVLVCGKHHMREKRGPGAATPPQSAGGAAPC